MKFKLENTFVFVYFLQEKKSQDLSYVGYLNSSTGSDLSQKGKTTYDSQEFENSFGFKPAFTKSSVKKVLLRENSVFRRKTIVVKDGDSKVSKYFMYFKLNAEGEEQNLFHCVCRGTTSKKSR